MKKSKRFYIGATGFLIGGTIGSVLTFLFTPTTGKKLRGDIQTGFNDYKTKAVNGINEYSTKVFEEGKRIIDEASKSFDEVISKADQLRTLSRNYISGAYSGPKERIEAEMISLKHALKAAIAAYKRTPERIQTRDNVVNNINTEFDDETLPKYEGMGHRRS